MGGNPNSAAYCTATRYRPSAGGAAGMFTVMYMLKHNDTAWRVMFLVGLFTAGVVWSYFRPEDYTFGIERSTGALIFAGLTVGVGTQIGSGCTSGHGVCGIGRLSKRSTVATITFMTTAAITVFVVNGVLGGAV